MKAVRINEFGGPEVLSIEEIERPVPEPDEILVKIYASGINPVDWAVREGANKNLRPYLSLPMTLGWDAAGTVEEIGSEVSGLKKGDAVYGVPNFPGNGSYAEYCVAKASQFTIKPSSLNFIQAAGVPLAGLTAWTGLFGHGKLQAGQRVLILGASGGVGGFAVQFAKAKGAFVIAVASTDNIAYLRELGADEVIDYKTQQYEQLLNNVDLVLEASPVRDNKERIKCIMVLKEGGTLVSVNTDFPFNEEVKNALAAKNVTGELAPNQPRRDWLQEIAELIDRGEVKVLISKVYPMDQVSDAQRESQSWHVRGKLILEILKED